MKGDTMNGDKPIIAIGDRRVSPHRSLVIGKSGSRSGEVEVWESEDGGKTWEQTK